jgi:DNA-binding CsgD family transcriptional regulator
MAQGRPISELMVKSVIRMWRSGASYREITDILKLSTSTVHKILRHDVDKRCALR